MILVDTSVWIDDVRSQVPELADALNTSHVFRHSMVMGGLVGGDLGKGSRPLIERQSTSIAVETSESSTIAQLETRNSIRRCIGSAGAYVRCIHLPTLLCAPLRYNRRIKRLTELFAIVCCNNV